MSNSSSMSDLGIRHCVLRGLRDTISLFPESRVNRASCIESEHRFVYVLVIEGRHILVR